MGCFESLNFIDLTVNTGPSLPVSWASHSEAISTQTYTLPSGHTLLHFNWLRPGEMCPSGCSMTSPSLLPPKVPRIQRCSSLLKAVEREERARDQYSLNFKPEPNQGSQPFFAGLNHAGVLCSGPIPCSSAPNTGVKKKTQKNPPHHGCSICGRVRRFPVPSQLDSGWRTTVTLFPPLLSSSLELAAPEGVLADTRAAEMNCH